MKSRAKITTEEQRKTWESITGKPVEAELPNKNIWSWDTDHMTPLEKNQYYTNNCLYWINEYRQGNAPIERAYKALTSLAKLLGEFEQLKNHKS